MQKTITIYTALHMFAGDQFSFFTCSGVSLWLLVLEFPPSAVTSPGSSAIPQAAAVARTALCHVRPSLRARSSGCLCPQGRGPQKVCGTGSGRRWDRCCSCPTATSGALNPGNPKIPAVKIAAVPSSVYEMVQSSRLTF